LAFFGLKDVSKSKINFKMSSIKRKKEELKQEIERLREIKEEDGDRNRPRWDYEISLLEAELTGITFAQAEACKIIKKYMKDIEGLQGTFPAPSIYKVYEEILKQLGGEEK